MYFRVVGITRGNLVLVSMVRWSVMCLTHQFIAFLRQQGVAVLQLANDGTQLGDLQLEATGVLLIQLLSLGKESHCSFTGPKEQPKTTSSVPGALAHWSEEQSTTESTPSTNTIGLL